ncbi:alpha/beta-hydrolase, partial [Calocera viscosa TUFC12733]
MQRSTSVFDGSSSSRAALTPLTFDDPDYTSALDFVGHGAFHQFIRCPRTGLRVSFSEAGPRDAPTILFCPPSFCSRYVGGPNVEGWARKMGVRVITIDRPGMGGTERCSIDERLEVSAQHVASVLEYLGIKKVALLSHSAGALYIMHLLANHPMLFGPSPRVYLIAPWIPTSISDQFGLQLVPSWIVGNQHTIRPVGLPLMKGMMSSFAFSSGLFQRENDKMDMSEWVVPERFRNEGEKYQPQPPFHTNLAASSEVGTLIDSCVLSEPLQGISQDYLMCLGRGGPLKEDWYKNIVEDLARGYKDRHEEVMVEVLWAGNDEIIPQKGRKWFDDLMGMAGDVIKYHSAELEGLGHDGPLSKIEVMGA